MEGFAIFVAFAPSCRFSREAGFIAANQFMPMKKLVSGLMIQIIQPKFLHESTIILQLKVYIACVVLKLVGHRPQQEYPINMA